MKSVCQGQLSAGRVSLRIICRFSSGAHDSKALAAGERRWFFSNKGGQYIAEQEATGLTHL